MATKIKFSKQRKGNAYIVIAGVLLFVCIFVSSGRIIFGDDSPFLQTPFNEEDTTLVGTGLILRSWEYDKNNNLMEVEVEQNDSFSVSGGLSFYAKEKQNPLQKIPVKTVAEFDNRFVLHIEEVPSDYEVMGLVIVQNNKMEYFDLDNIELFSDEQNNDNEEDEISVTFYGDNRIIPEVENIKEKPLNEYIVQSIDNEVNVLESEIKEIENRIPKNQELIKGFEKEIETLEVEKKFQTVSESMETDSAVTGYQMRIEEVERNISDIEEAIKEKQEKIQKITEKKEHLLAQK